MPGLCTFNGVYFVRIHLPEATRSSNYSPPHHMADPAPIAGKPVSQAAGDNGLLGPDTMC